MKRQSLAGVLCGFALTVGGCYRSASLDLDEVRRIEPESDGVSARVVDRGGRVRRYADHHGVEVHARTRSVDIEESFERPLRIALDDRSLSVAGRDSSRTFERGDVEKIKLYESAPERPWIIVGATLAAALMGGVIGFVAGGECGPELGCLDNGIFAIGGTAAGFTVGLPLSIVLSGQLRPEPELTKH